MKTKPARWAAVILVTTVILAGCAKQPSALSILPEIRDYNLAMSSTPGIPLTAVYTRDLKNSNYKYHWVAEEGTFLKWNDSGGFGRVDVLGPDVLTNLHKVFWTMDSGKPIQKSAFQVRLTVEEVGTGTIVDEARLEIHQNESGHFTISD